MKPLLLLVALLVWLPGAAQPSRPVVGPDDGATALAAPVPDTVAALHRLFAAKRTRSYIITGTLVAGVLTGGLASEGGGGGSGGSSFGGQNCRLVAGIML